jgi:signal transduction histidine kinase
VKRLHFLKRLRHSRLTIRARLTLVYGGLFLLAGVLLLGVTYVLVSHQLSGAENGNVSGRSLAPGSGRPTVSPQPPANGAISPPAGVQAFIRQVANDRDNSLRTLLIDAGIALALVGATATGFGWLIAGRLLKPLHQVTETARRIADAPAADRSLHERIALYGPHDEIKELADTFNIMLERLDHSFDGQRRFIANASHELRTPLTLNRTLLEVALGQETTSPEVHQLGTNLLAINSRHGRLIDGLLLLARSERDVTDRSYVDLADIVEHVAAQVPPGTVTVLTEPAEAETTGNLVLLERLVQNLVENGVRHNIPENGWVRIASDTRPDGTAVLQVSNTGPVVPRYEIPSLFEPFHRLAEDRRSTTPGAGLGLSIVRAVARAHGGDVRAEPRNGGGLLVTVTLPGCTDTAWPDDHPPPPDRER